MPKFKVELEETVTSTMTLVIEAPEGTDPDVIRERAHDFASDIGSGWYEEDSGIEAKAPTALADDATDLVDLRMGDNDDA